MPTASRCWVQALVGAVAGVPLSTAQKSYATAMLTVGAEGGAPPVEF
jgi:hypothetical protein